MKKVGGVKMNAIHRTVGAALLAITIAGLAGCYAYVDDDHYHRRGYYSDNYYYRDNPRAYSYSYYSRDRYYGDRW
jgi:hypothetical protein